MPEPEVLESIQEIVLESEQSTKENFNEEEDKDENDNDNDSDGHDFNNLVYRENYEADGVFDEAALSVKQPSHFPEHSYM